MTSRFCHAFGNLRIARRLGEATLVFCNGRTVSFVFLLCACVCVRPVRGCETKWRTGRVVRTLRICSALGTRATCEASVISTSYNSKEKKKKKIQKQAPFIFCTLARRRDGVQKRNKMYYTSRRLSQAAAHVCTVSPHLVTF